jgi:gephyrin
MFLDFHTFHYNKSIYNKSEEKRFLLTMSSSSANNASPISVEEAIKRVLHVSTCLSIETLTIGCDLLGRTLAESLTASSPFPAFPASIMDGYAVKAPLEPGIYRIVDSVFAGDHLIEGKEVITSHEEVTYITTGSQVPSGANAVVKVEDTEKLQDDTVRIKVSTKEGQFIRQIGSDIEAGQVVLSSGDRLGSVELGLLATMGFTKVKCYKKPVVGIISTGNELVDFWKTPIGSQIRDSNRISLITSFQEDGYEVIDYGIMKDSFEDTRMAIIRIVEEGKVDVLVSSGGVSMGNADFIKPILQELGTIHFNKLNMKPGKPTTFATILTRNAKSASGDNEKTILFFGLPGNPV